MIRFARRVVLVAVLAALVPAGAGVSAAPAYREWTPDLVHSRAEFTVSHLVVSKVWGHFPIRQLTFATVPNGVQPVAISAVLDVVRMDTDNKTRDAELRSATYFDTEHYPTMTFKSTNVTRQDASDFKIDGELTIKNVTKPVSFVAHLEGAVPDDATTTRVGYSGDLTIDRRDFGLVDERLTGAGVLLVGNAVHIALTLEATTKGNVAVQ
jgi:polyisoprenoid-binding protein YceI